MCQEFQFDKLFQNDGENDAGAKKGEERSVAKSKPMAMNLSSTVLASSSSANNHEKEVTGTPVAHEKVTGKLVASRNSENSGNRKAKNRKWPHNFHVSSAVVPHMEKSFRS